MRRSALRRERRRLLKLSEFCLGSAAVGRPFFFDNVLDEVARWLRSIGGGSGRKDFLKQGIFLEVTYDCVS